MTTLSYFFIAISDLNSWSLGTPLCNFLLVLAAETTNQWRRTKKLMPYCDFIGNNEVGLVHAAAPTFLHQYSLRRCMLTLDETERTLLPHQRESDTVVLAIIHDRTAQMTHANINYERKQQRKRRAVARICLIDIENGKHQRQYLAN